MNRLDIVGFGPGAFEGMTLEAKNSIENCDYIVGFNTYIKLLQEYFPDKNYVQTGMGAEVERTNEALKLADKGNYVCLVCSGDSQVYGMAGLAYELGKNYADVEIHTVPGVTAALSGSAILGAAAGNDICLISLSDYHTEWTDIEKRLKACAQCDFVIAMYNPRSRKRPDGLEKACDILMNVLPENRICGVAENIGRDGQNAKVMTLGELRGYEANMFTTVFVGNSKTIDINGKMVTPRGYNIE